MTRPSAAPRNARSRRTYDALLAAARELIEESGIEAVTMSAVADRAGVSRRAVYLHVASRSELVQAVFAHVNEAEDVAASLARVWDAPDAAATLDAWAAHLGGVHPRLIPSTRAVERVRSGNPDAGRLWQLIAADWNRCCRRIAARLADEGVLAAGWTRRSAAGMLRALMSHDLLDTLLHEQGWTPARFVTQYARLLRSTFLAEGAD